MKVYALRGGYEDTACYGVFSTEEKANAALYGSSLGWVEEYELDPDTHNWWETTVTVSREGTLLDCSKPKYVLGGSVFTGLKLRTFWAGTAFESPRHGLSGMKSMLSSRLVQEYLKVSQPCEDRGIEHVECPIIALTHTSATQHQAEAILLAQSIRRSVVTQNLWPRTLVPTSDHFSFPVFAEERQEFSAAQKALQGWYASCGTWEEVTNV